MAAFSSNTSRCSGSLFLCFARLSFPCIFLPSLLFLLFTFSFSWNIRIIEAQFNCRLNELDERLAQCSFSCCGTADCPCVDASDCSASTSRSSSSRREERNMKQQQKVTTTPTTTTTSSLDVVDSISVRHRLDVASLCDPLLVTVSAINSTCSFYRCLSDAIVASECQLSQEWGNYFLNLNAQVDQCTRIETAFSCSVGEYQASLECVQNTSCMMTATTTCTKECYGSTVSCFASFHCIPASKNYVTFCKSYLRTQAEACDACFLPPIVTTSTAAITTTTETPIRAGGSVLTPCDGHYRRCEGIDEFVVIIGGSDGNIGTPSLSDTELVIVVVLTAIAGILLIVFLFLCVGVAVARMKRKNQEGKEKGKKDGQQTIPLTHQEDHEQPETTAVVSLIDLHHQQTVTPRGGLLSSSVSNAADDEVDAYDTEEEEEEENETGSLRVQNLAPVNSGDRGSEEDPDAVVDLSQHQSQQKEKYRKNRNERKEHHQKKKKKKKMHLKGEDAPGPTPQVDPGSTPARCRSIPAGTVMPACGARIKGKTKTTMIETFNVQGQEAEEEEEEGWVDETKRGGGFVESSSSLSIEAIPRRGHQEYDTVSEIALESSPHCRHHGRQQNLKNESLFSSTSMGQEEEEEGVISASTKKNKGNNVGSGEGHGDYGSSPPPPHSHTASNKSAATDHSNTSSSTAFHNDSSLLPVPSGTNTANSNNHTRRYSNENATVTTTATSTTLMSATTATANSGSSPYPRHHQKVTKRKEGGAAAAENQRQQQQQRRRRRDRSDSLNGDKDDDAYALTIPTPSESESESATRSSDLEDYDTDEQVEEEEEEEEQGFNQTPQGSEMSLTVDVTDALAAESFMVDRENDGTTLREKRASNSFVVIVSGDGEFVDEDGEYGGEEIASDSQEKEEQQQEKYPKRRMKGHSDVSQSNNFSSNDDDNGHSKHVHGNSEDQQSPSQAESESNGSAGQQYIHGKKHDADPALLSNLPTTNSTSPESCSADPMTGIASTSSSAQRRHQQRQDYRHVHSSRRSNKTRFVEMSEDEIVENIRTGNYTRGRLLGRGATSCVYAVRFPNGFMVAVKEIDASQNTLEELRELAHHFVEFVAVRHPHVCATFFVSAHEFEKVIRVWMEYLPHGSVTQVARKFLAKNSALLEARAKEESRWQEQALLPFATSPVIIDGFSPMVNPSEVGESATTTTIGDTPPHLNSSASGGLWPHQQQQFLFPAVASTNRMMIASGGGGSAPGAVRQGGGLSPFNDSSTLTYNSGVETTPSVSTVGGLFAGGANSPSAGASRSSASAALTRDERLSELHSHLAAKSNLSVFTSASSTVPVSSTLEQQQHGHDSSKGAGCGCGATERSQQLPSAAANNGTSSSGILMPNSTQDRAPLGIPESIVKEITRQLISALDYLHREGIMHRDVKGCNVLLQSPLPLDRPSAKKASFSLNNAYPENEFEHGAHPSGVFVKLIDFGTAKMMSEKYASLSWGQMKKSVCNSSSPISPSISNVRKMESEEEGGKKRETSQSLRPPQPPIAVTHSLVGTPLWMAPEVLRSSNSLMGTAQPPPLAAPPMMGGSNHQAQSNAKKLTTASPGVNENEGSVAQERDPQDTEKEEEGGGGYTYAADVWSVGITVAEMLNGGWPPWPRFSTHWAAMLYLSQNTHSPTFPDGITPGCKAFLERCWVRDPRGRATLKELQKHEWLAS